MNYLVTIGLEVHCCINTEAKIFSWAYNKSNANANTCVDWVDLALPGTLPRVNFEVIKKAIILGKVLNMKINYQNIGFDRKHYFYFDLSKGYQITQHYHPIAINGYIDLEKNKKRIHIKQIQIEEDTAKHLVVNDNLYLDFNRAGAPLFEIVSEPNFENAAEVLEYLIILKRYLVFLNLSDGKIELGNLRVDLNISLRKNQNDPHGTKIEIKNISSFSAIEKAINYEIQRQMDLYENNPSEIVQSTRKWNEKLEITEFMRNKKNAIDYRFIAEPNLPHFALTEQQFNEIILSMPKIPKEIEEELLNAGMSNSEVEHVLDNYDLYQAMIELNNYLKNWKKTYKWFGIEILGYLKKANLNYELVLSKTKDELIKTIIAIESTKIINAKQAKIVFMEIINEKLTFEQAINKHQFMQITDLSILEKIVQEILVEQKNNIDKMLNNATKLEKFIIGQIMIQTKGQANPNIAKIAYDNIAKKLLN